MSEKDAICTACTSVNPPDLRTDRFDNNCQGASSLSSQGLLSASSAPFVPRNSDSQQQEQDEDKKALSVSDAGIPKTLPQQQGNKKSLSVSSPSFDPSWRQKLGKSPALPLPAGSTITTPTATSTTQRDSRSVRGGLATMMMAPDVYDHPMNMMPLPPMPIGEVTQAEPEVTHLISVAICPPSPF